MPDFSSMPEAFVSDAALAPAVSREVKRATLRKLASRLYTRNLKDPPEQIVLRNLWPLVGAYLPGGLISDRTALDFRPAADGSIFLISNHKRDIVLPGVVIRPRKGPPALESDRQFIGGLRIASQARAFLENMQPSRSTGRVARTLPRGAIEDRLDEMLRNSGGTALQRLRDEAREISTALDMQEEFRSLDALMGAMLGSRRASLQSPIAIARAAGSPYDPHRLDLFQKLHAELAVLAPITRPARGSDGPALPFFEAYFSNFIEGTEFAVDEAADIIFKGVIPKARPADAHDILGTWRLVSDAHEMSRTPRTVEELLEILKTRHALLMAGRPAQGPGQFKTASNRAGSTLFVSPELVKGTLAQGFEIHRSLTSPFHRAVFMMFLISEVHPFADGNGRIARILMNSELISKGETRIIVPTVYRNNYLMALKALSQNRLTGPLPRTLDFAQRYTAAIDFGSIDRARFLLDRTHAFADPQEADVAGVRLTLPTSDVLVDGLE